LVALLPLALTSGSPGAEHDETTKLDCGVNALFVLLHLEGCPATLDRVQSALPAPHPAGYSMAELAAAARKFGLYLEGVEFRKVDNPLDRPAILFSTTPQGGHFAVFRPVGTTGTMVQVIDPPNVPWIADYDRLASGKPWTGSILVRRDAWIVRNMISLVMALAGCVLLVVGLSHRLRTARAKRGALSVKNSLGLTLGANPSAF